MSHPLLNRLSIFLQGRAAVLVVGFLIYTGYFAQAQADNPTSGNELRGEIATHVIAALTLIGAFSVSLTATLARVAGIVVRLVNVLWIDAIVAIALSADIGSSEVQWNVFGIALLMFGPPLALYLLYRSIYWVFKGHF